MSSSMLSTMSSPYGTSAIPLFGPQMYRPQAIVIPSWNGRSDTYEAWKAQLLPALEQLGFDDHLINRNPTDADVMALLDMPKGHMWDAAL